MLEHCGGFLLGEEMAEVERPARDAHRVCTKLGNRGIGYSSAGSGVTPSGSGWRSTLRIIETIV